MCFKRWKREVFVSIHFFVFLKRGKRYEAVTAKLYSSNLRQCSFVCSLEDISGVQEPKNHDDVTNQFLRGFQWQNRGRFMRGRTPKILRITPLSISSFPLLLRLHFGSKKNWISRKILEKPKWSPIYYPPSQPLHFHYHPSLTSSV